MTYTIEERHAIYKKASEEYAKDTHTEFTDYVGLCHYMMIGMAFISNHDKHYLEYDTDNLPEFIACKPINTSEYGMYWWSKSSYGITQRKKILAKLIAETEPKD